MSEQKKVLKAATSHGVQALVVEMMSIRSESIFVESHRILLPDILVITNIFPDHREQWGKSKDSVALSLAAAIHDHCQVFMPAKDVFPVFQSLLPKAQARIHAVSWENEGNWNLNALDSRSYEFVENKQLTLAVATHLGIPKEQAVTAMTQSTPDFGSLRVWSFLRPKTGQTRYCVSAFAANDPQSCQQVLDRLIQIPELKEKPFYGLLNLRRDRGDRTLQWAEAIALGHFADVEKILILGDHAHAFKRRCAAMNSRITLIPLREKSSQQIMDNLFLQEPEELVIVGMGNMAGAGRSLVEHWQEKGNPYAL